MRPEEILKFICKKWSLLVKEWSYELWIDDHHEESESHDKEPHVDEEVLSSPLDDLHNDGNQWKHDQLANYEFLDLQIYANLL